MAKTRIESLPEECVVHILSFTSPRDACRSSTVSSFFREVADSNQTWRKFLPSDYADIASRSVHEMEFSSMKDLFLKLSSTPLLIDGGRKTFAIDKYTNKKMYMVSTKELSITWASNNLNWCRKPLLQSRFPESVELIMVCWLEIHGKIDSGMLSSNTGYGAYLVFQVAERAFGLGTLPWEVIVEVGDHKTRGWVYMELGGDDGREREGGRGVISRADGWLEVELGEFHNDGTGNEVKMWLREIKGEHLKGGLLVEVESTSEMRSFSEIPEDETVSPSVDLVAAARRNLVFLRILADSQWLHHKPTILEAIRRYDQLWMPLIADLSKGSTKPPMILPPLDVEWIWFCHSLRPANYRCYCEARFSKIIGKPAIFYEGNEEYALDRCRKMWEDRFPSEPFENEVDPNLENCSVVSDEDLLEQALKMGYLCRAFSEPYNSEMVFLIAANQRYRGFIYMIHKYANECSCSVPTSDVLLMWLTHKSYPTVYAMDIKELELDVEKIVMESDKEEDIEETKMLWERTFDQPYEKAGVAVIARSIVNESPVYLDVTHSDVNTNYESMVPRFLLEVCVSVKINSNMKETRRDFSRDFLRFRMAKCHWELKIDKPLSNFFDSKSWRKAVHLYCEFGTKEMILELRNHGGRIFKGSTLQRKITFPWNDLLRAPSLIVGKELNLGFMAVASITPPVQASYLLKCVPDRVTDDSGAMISDVILRMNHYRPQEGRWLSRTVLNHAGRECFVARMRVGGGFWRRGGEAPKAMKWGDRIIEICEGSWSYVTSSSSIGRAPEKVVGTASPKEPLEGYKASWSFSTGDELNIMWDATSSISSMSFDLHHKIPTKSMVKLLKGRQMQYHIKKSCSEAVEQKQDINQGTVKEGEFFEEEYFVTVVRFSEENPIGKATALLNWKLLMVELLPEEDAVLVLLLCLSVLRSASVMKREDVGNLLVRRRVREAKAGERDWGSVILHPSSYSSHISSPYIHPWYWNASLFVPSKDQIASPPSLSYSQAEGEDNLYKSGIIS